MNVSIMSVRGRADLTAESLSHLRLERLGRILVVNNGTDDETRSLLVDWRRRDARVAVIDMPGCNLHACWNAAWDSLSCLPVVPAEGVNAWFVNNDMTPYPGSAEILGDALRSRPDAWIVYPDYRRSVAEGMAYPEIRGAPVLTETHGSYRHGGMSGWSFMVRAELAIRFDEQFEIWAADDDLAFQVDAAGGRQYRVDGLPVDHLGEATVRQHPELEAAKGRDMRRLSKKWAGRS